MPNKYKNGLVVLAAIILTVAAGLSVIAVIDSTTTYSVQGSESENGTVEGYGSYKYGAYVTLIAIPDEGFEFKEWYDEDEETVLSTDAEYIFQIFGNKRITAIFKIEEFRVSVNIIGEAEITGEGYYLPGTEVTLSVTPHERYTFIHWEHDGQTFDEYTYEFIIEKHTVIRCVLEGDPCEIKITLGDNIVTATPSGTHEYGSKIELSATAADGYLVKEWESEGTVVGYGAKIIYEVRGDATVHVTAKIELDATFTATQTGFSEPYTFTCNSNDSVEYTNSWSAEGVVTFTSLKYGEIYQSKNLGCHPTEDSYGVWNLEITYPYGIEVEDMRSITITHTVTHDGDEEKVSNTYSAYGWTHSYIEGFSQVDNDHSLFLDLKLSDYYAEKMYSDQWNNKYDIKGRPDSLWEEMVKRNSTIEHIAESIDIITEGMTKIQKAQCILDFVTYTVEYTSDSDLYGREEYFATAYGTLYLRKGDCEDSSILFVSLASYCGFTTYLISPPGHMAGGVLIAGTEGNFSGQFTGVNFCETTLKGAQVGYLPPDYIGVNCTLRIVTVHNYP